MTALSSQLQRWRWPGLALLACLVLAALAPHYLMIGRYATAWPATSDFYKFYRSAQRVSEGHSMYWLMPPREKPGDTCHPDTPDDRRTGLPTHPGPLTLGGPYPCLNSNLNPPIFTALITPLTSLPYATAWWVWAGVSALCLAMACWVVARLWHTATMARAACALALTAAMVAFYPTLGNFRLGQTGTLLLCLLTLSWWHARQGGSGWGGWWLGLALALKPFWGLLLLGAAAARHWRLALVASFTAAVAWGLGVALYGWQTLAQYLALARHINWKAANWNASWFGLIDRHFSGRPGAHWPADQALSTALGTALAGATLASALWLLWRTQGADSTAQTARADSLFALMIPTALLASPLGWMYYFPCLLITTVVLWRQIGPGPQQRTWRLLMALPLGLCMVPVSLAPAPSAVRPAQVLGPDSVYFAALLLVWLGVMATRYTTRQRPK